MYDKVSTDLKFVEREKEAEKFWEDKHISEKSIQMREGCKPYMFYGGPLTANGKPRIGHVGTRVIKNMTSRYCAMKGYMVPHKAGWDTHGLPVGLEVGKKLGLDGKDQIKQYGPEPLIRQCKENVWKHKDTWEDFSNTIGLQADMDDPYVTYESNFIESEWWALKQIWGKDLLHKGFKVIPYYPCYGTPLSSRGVAQGYKDVEERSAITRLKVKGEDVYILAWTTMPWTLPSDLALCVNPVEDYVKVKIDDDYTYYIAQALATQVLGEDYKVLEIYRDGDSEFKEYKPLYDCLVPLCKKQHKKAYYVVYNTCVTLTDGTGIVCVAPAFGEDDANVGCKYDLPLVQLVDAKGDMTAETPFAGTFVKDANPLVLKDLESRGLLLTVPAFEHSYPHCWRRGTPLTYYARESWFIKITAIKDDLIRNNSTISWVPDSIGKGRFDDWLESTQDWGISRNRHWGTPLSIWECQYGYQHSTGSIEGLKNMFDNCPEDIEPYCPYTDSVNVWCSKRGKSMKCVPEVIGYWSDSGAMPFTQRHYPFENKELFESQFLAQFIFEAAGQTRGWLYSLLVESILLFNKAPCEDAVVMGLVLDENEQKMSKFKGNAVNPFDTLTAHGADAVCWFFYACSAPWLPKRYQDKAVTEGQRKFMGTLWSIYAFRAFYANTDNFDATKYNLEYDKLLVADKWLLFKMNFMTKCVDENLMNYQIPKAARSLQESVDDMSNWYVRKSRECFWAEGVEQDKINACMTLYTTPMTTAKAAAPMIPFIIEQIYQNIARKINGDVSENIHLCDFLEMKEDWIDVSLGADMDEMLKTVVTGRAARNTVNIKNRQPIGQVYTKADHVLSKFYVEIIEDEPNVEQAIFSDDVRALTSYTFKPQLKTAGSKYGKLPNRIRQILVDIDGSAAMDIPNEKGVLTFDLDGQEAVLIKDDLLIDVSQEDGYVTEEDNYVTVVLDTNLTPGLIERGFIREIISKVQTMRKEAGFEVVDHIATYQDDSDKITEFLKAYADEIKVEVMADTIFLGGMGGYTKEWSINSEKMMPGAEKTMK